MQIDSTVQATLNSLEVKARQAEQAGRDQEALQHWGQILDIAPNHSRTLTSVGKHAFRTGDVRSARVAFQRVVDTDGRDPHQWLNLALACRTLEDEAGEEAAIAAALKLDPSELVALVLRGNLLERQGKAHLAARAYGAASIVSPPLERIAPDLRPAISHAITYRDNYNMECSAFLDAHLQPLYKEFSGEHLKRFQDSVDILLGRKDRYESHPLVHFYPGLPAIEFFERDGFPWLDAFESATDQIRDEFLNVFESDHGFAPYVQYAEGSPLNQWAELNHSARWSAFHFFKNGERLTENADRCPITMELLATAPQPVQSGRTPAALYSLLKPKTRIPPHTGASNVRLLAHVPLIIPDSCGFRVGNESREWVPGKAWVFDDTIQHEAWNNSDQLRVIMIFDIWHPHLSVAERTLIGCLSTALTAFMGEDAESFET